MELRDCNYQLPKLLKKLRALLRRDQDWLKIAFQRSVILTRKDQERKHALTRIDFFRSTDNIPSESDRDYKQIRFIAQKVTPDTVIARLKRLKDLRFTAGTLSVKFPQNAGFYDDYRPRNNEFSEWPGTYFDATLESSLFLSQDALVHPVLPIRESEHEAVAEFLNFPNFSSHDGRLGHIVVFVPNFNGRIEDLALSGRNLSVQLKVSRPFDDLILDIDYSSGERTGKTSIAINGLTESIDLGFEPKKMNIWLKSRHGYVLDYHKETPEWSVGVHRVLPELKRTAAYANDPRSIDDFSFPEAIFDTRGNVIFAGEEGSPASAAAQAARCEIDTEFDVFISHATEDKGYVEPLAAALKSAGIRVWFDKTTLEWGDDLRPAIDRGLINCRYGIVVFSKAFLGKKKWTEYELNALFAREKAGKKLILPIWHDVSYDDLIRYSPAFADRLAKISRSDSYDEIVKSLLAMLDRPPLSPAHADVPDSKDVRNSYALQMTQKASKPNAVAYARYETTGENAVAAESYVRPSADRAGWFTFENSLGEEQHGTMEEIAMRFAMFDKSLTIKGYIRKQYGNSGDRMFNL